MKDKDRILVRSLAVTDAIHLPFRDWDGRRAAVTCECRRDYAKVGFPRKLVNAETDDRMAEQRRFVALKDAVLIELLAPNVERRTNLRLTETGDVYTRALCGVPNVDSGVARIIELSRMTRGKGTAQILGVEWVPETLLAGKEYGTPGAEKECRIVEDLMLPALVRGWVTSKSDVLRHVWYTLTESGLERAEAFVATEEIPSDGDYTSQLPDGLPAENGEATKLYDECVLAELARLAKAKPRDDRDIGQIPLPVSVLVR